MKRTLLGAVIASLLIAAPAQAFISKKEGRRYAVREVRALYYTVDWATDYWVEHSPQCDRLGANVIECDYEIYDDVEGVTCYDAVRIINASLTHYRVRWPYKSDCVVD